MMMLFVIIIIINKVILVVCSFLYEGAVGIHEKNKFYFINDTNKDYSLSVAVNIQDSQTCAILQPKLKNKITKLRPQAEKLNNSGCLDINSLIFAS